MTPEAYAWAMKILRGKEPAPEATPDDADDDEEPDLAPARLRCNGP